MAFSSVLLVPSPAPVPPAGPSGRFCGMGGLNPDTSAFLRSLGVKPKDRSDARPDVAVCHVCAHKADFAGCFNRDSHTITRCPVCQLIGQAPAPGNSRGLCPSCLALAHASRKAADVPF